MPSSFLFVRFLRSLIGHLSLGFHFGQAKRSIMVNWQPVDPAGNDVIKAPLKVFEFGSAARHFGMHLSFMASSQAPAQKTGQCRRQDPDFIHLAFP
jgi:hypothetical protein